MLIVAGIIEGFVSPSDLAVKWKYTLAAGLFGLLLLYVMRKGPKSPRPPAAEVPGIANPRLPIGGQVPIGAVSDSKVSM